MKRILCAFGLAALSLTWGRLASATDLDNFNKDNFNKAVAKAAPTIDALDASFKPKHVCTCVSDLTPGVLVLDLAMHFNCALSSFKLDGGVAGFTSLCWFHFPLRWRLCHRAVGDRVFRAAASTRLIYHRLFSVKVDDLMQPATAIPARVPMCEACGRQGEHWRCTYTTAHDTQTCECGCRRMSHCPDTRAVAS
jgi:hypothetical protein